MLFVYMYNIYNYLYYNFNIINWILNMYIWLITENIELVISETDNVNFINREYSDQDIALDSMDANRNDVCVSVEKDRNAVDNNAAWVQ